MKVRLNGKEEILKDQDWTLARLIESKGAKPELVAVEVNLEIIPRDAFQRTALREGDVVEIVKFTGGG